MTNTRYSTNFLNSMQKEDQSTHDVIARYVDDVIEEVKSALIDDNDSEIRQKVIKWGMILDEETSMHAKPGSAMDKMAKALSMLADAARTHLIVLNPPHPRTKIFGMVADWMLKNKVTYLDAMTLVVAANNVVIKRGKGFKALHDEVIHLCDALYLDCVKKDIKGKFPPSFFYGVWADNGFPIVTLPQKIAAALVLTDPSEEPTPAWTGFTIKVPDDLLIHPTMGTVKYIQAVYTDFNTLGEYVWSFLVISKNYISSITIKSMLDGLVSDNDDNAEKRMTHAVVCLAAGVLNLLESKDNYTTKKPTEKRSRKKPKLSKKVKEQHIPSQDVYITKDVDVDLTSAVVGWLADEYKTSKGGKTGRKQKVRSLIRGHKKNVAYGPRHSLHYSKWIMPTWRGPVGAPVLAKTYNVKTKKKKK